MILTDKWIVGFVDGDGCFKIVQTATGKRYVFVVSQDKRSVDVLYALKTKFGCGSVNKAGNNMREFRVTNQEHLKNHILPFFCKNPLQTLKINDFKIFYQELMGGAENTQNTNLVETSICRDWLTGFIDAEANFHVSMVKDYPRPQFVIGLHLRDEAVLNRIKDFLNCGLVYRKNQKKNYGPLEFACSPANQAHNKYAVYQISNQDGFKRLIKVCTTDTNRCLLKTTKRIDFLKFKQIVRIILDKKHLTADGILRIKKILQKKIV